MRHIGEITTSVLRRNAERFADYIPRGLVQAEIERLVRRRLEVAEIWLSYCESPIEAQLGAHLAFTPIFEGLQLDCYPELYVGGPEADPLDYGAVPGPHDRERMARHPRRYEIWAQQRVGGYRADFLAVLKPAGLTPPRFAIVEADGHDFHERTPEQAARDKARDRAFAEHGYAVLRFTGREITRDAASCAAQVARVVEGMEGA